MKPNLIQWILLTLAALSAFTLQPAKSSVREMAQLCFVPIAWPVHAVGLWAKNRLAPLPEPDIVSPANPRSADQIRHENSLLHARIDQLEAQLDDLTKRYERYAVLSPDLQKSVEPATVIATPNTGEPQVLTISTTGLRSIKERMPVIHSNGFVGQVLVVSPAGATARVMLATDVNSHLSARFIRLAAQADGSMRSQRIDLTPQTIDGNGRSMTFKLAARDAQAKLKVDDIALLEDPRFPSSLLGERLGTIRKITTTPANLLATIELEPTTDFTRLHDVLVVNK